MVGVCCAVWIRSSLRGRCTHTKNASPTSQMRRGTLSGTSLRDVLEYAQTGSQRQTISIGLGEAHDSLRANQTFHRSSNEQIKHIIEVRRIHYSHDTVQRAITVIEEALKSESLPAGAKAFGVEMLRQLKYMASELT